MSLRSSARRVLARATRAVSGPPRREAVNDEFERPIAPRETGAGTTPRIVLLNDCRDQISFGSNALSDGLIAILSESVPTAEILPIPSHWLVQAPDGFRSFANGGIGLRQPNARYPTVADQFESVADDWLAGRGGGGAEQFMSRLRTADLVVLNGEGSIYRTNVSAIRELFLAWLAKTRFGVPTVYLNGGMHLTQVVPILPGMVRKTFPVLDAVAVREPWSLRNLQEYVPGVDARLVPDAAYYFRPADVRATPTVRAVRERLGDAPYFTFDPGSMPMDAAPGGRSALHELTRALLDVVPHALFVPMQPADRYVEAVARETGAVFTDAVVDYREFMALVEGAEFHVSGRHHNVILAALVGCPTVPFDAVTHKVRGACEMLDGLLDPVYDGTSMRPCIGAIADHARRYVGNRDDLRAALLDVSSRNRTAAFELGQIAADALGIAARPPSPSEP